MHPDHYLDLVPLRYGLRYGKTGTQPINVWLPPGGTDHLRRLGNCLSMTQPFFEGAFTFHEYLPDVPFTIGGLNVTPVPVRHSVPSHALRIVGSGRTLVYSSDTAPCSDLDEVATGADILLAETTLGTEAFTSGSDLHLGAPDAGRVARVANANRLVLTHFWPGTDREEARFAAMREFSGVVKIAWPHLTMAI
jgi:ribonuclease BN (tRNA processing enzyme)